MSPAPPGVPSSPPTPPGRADSTDFLVASGVEFYEGTYAEFTPGWDLVVVNTAEQIEMCDAIVDSLLPPSIFQRVESWCLRVWRGPLHGRPMRAFDP